MEGRVGARVVDVARRILTRPHLRSLECIQREERWRWRSQLRRFAYQLVDQIAREAVAAYLCSRRVQWLAIG